MNLPCVEVKSGSLKKLQVRSPDYLKKVETMALVIMNPTQAIKPQNANPVSQSVEPGDTFQKALKQQLTTQQEAQKSRDAVAKTSEPENPESTRPDALEDPKKVKQDHKGLNLSRKKGSDEAEKTSVTQGRQLEAKENVKVNVTLLDPWATLQNSSQIESGKADAMIKSSSKEIPDDEASLHNNMEKDVVTTDNPLLPMLNMLGFSSTIQSKLDAAGNATDNSTMGEESAKGINEKPLSSSSELLTDPKLAKGSSAVSKDSIDLLQFAEHQDGFKQKIADVLKDSPSFPDDLALKSSQKQDSPTIPVVAMSPPAMTINSPQLVASNTIAPQLGSLAWNDAIGQKIIWMVGAEQQSATLTLNPPDLGPVQVVIQVHNEQADTTFISQNPEVRQALEDGLDNLRNMMTNSGIQLGQANVHAEQQYQQQPQQQSQTFTPSMMNSNASDASQAEVTTLAKVMTSNGLVDTFA